MNVIRSLAGLNELRHIWDSLSSGWASPMKSHDWLRICVEVFDLDGALEVVVAGSGETVAVAPLFRSRQDGRRLELIGQDQLHEVMDFLYSERSDVDALARTLARLRHPVRLKRIPADSPIADALARAYRKRGIVIARPTEGVPWIPLDQSWTTPEQHLNAGRRSDLRRARRVAAAMGPLSFEVLAPGPAELAPLLQEAYAVEAAGWKGRKGSALAHDALVGEFFHRYAAEASSHGILRICFVRIGGRAAAIQIAAETGNRFWLLKIGYSDEFARCSPGMLLMMESIRYAARSGLSSYEFLGGDDRWIRVWTPLVRRCVRVRTYPCNVGGGMALARDAMSAIRTRAKRVLP